jgi:hypothetical protein
MTPLISRSRGLACLAAAERIANAKGDSAKHKCSQNERAIVAIGWCCGNDGGPVFDYNRIGSDFNRTHAMLALTWCATIAGEA